MNWIKYLLEANLYLGLFYVVYYLLLRRETHYQLNRAYLLGSSVLAFAIPVLQLGFLKPIIVTVAQVIEAPVANYTYVKPVTNNIVINEPEVQLNYYLLAYAIITAVMAISLVVRIFQLSKLAKKGKHITVNNLQLIELEDENHGFSFFSYLFISKKLSSSATIIQHELVHIRQKHSLDIMYMEVIKVICWFNPVVYLIQNSVKELHEFIADDHIVSMQQDVNQYTDFLINNAYGLPEATLTNNFFNKNLLKKRIMMLHQKRSGSLARLKYLVALPLLAGMLCLSTLGFTKDYTVIDVAPHAKVIDNAKNIPTLPSAPARPKNFKETKKGFKYAEAVWRVNGKSLPYVTVIDNEGFEHDYFRNTATKADIKLLSDKYGYTFPQLYPPPVVRPDVKKYVVRLPPPVVTAKGEEPNLFPKVFSPGNNGAHLKPHQYDKMTDLKYSIYSKFGVKMFTSDDNALGWDGSMKGQPAPEDTYFWNATFNLGDKTMSQKGFITLVRGSQSAATTVSDYDKFYAYIRQSIHYPADALKDKIVGKIFVVFSVDDDHKIRNIGVLRGLYDSQNNEVVRVLKAATVPAEMKSGVKYTLPLSFNLVDNDGKEVESKGYVTDKSIVVQKYTPTSFPIVTLSEVVVQSYINK